MSVRVLVTGGAGFIGSHLVERLVAEGHAVDVVDDLSTGRLANLAAARADAKAAGVELRVHTLAVGAVELDALVQRRTPDVIVHLAGPDTSAATPEVFSIVAGGAVSLLWAARRHGVRRFVAVASSDVYAPATPKQVPITEQHPRQPASMEAAAQLAMLEMLSAARHHDHIEFVCLVLADVYGPRALRGPVARAAAARAALAPLRIEGSGTQTRDFVHVDDVSDALTRSLTSGSGVVLNIGTGTETTLLQLAERAGVTVEHVPGREGERARVALDPSRAAIHLGWTPFTSLADGLASAWFA